MGTGPGEVAKGRIITGFRTQGTLQLPGSSSGINTERLRCSDRELTDGSY